MKKILILSFLFVCGCATMQRTLHYATLGLVKDPSVSEKAKVELLESQQRTELQYREIRRYHTMALGGFAIGMLIVVASRVAATYVPFLKPEDGKVGWLVIAGSAALSLWGSALGYPVYLFGGVMGFGAVFVVYKLVTHKKEHTCELDA